MPRSIMIDDIDDATASWLMAEAKRQGVSVERVAGQLLQRGLEWERRRTALPTYHDLDALAGTWSEDEAMAFLQAVADFEHVDPALWQ
jgi:plasmid stability protein